MTGLEEKHQGALQAIKFLEIQKKFTQLHNAKREDDMINTKKFRQQEEFNQVLLAKI